MSDRHPDQLPVNWNAERLILGAILTAPAPFVEFASLLVPDDFSIEKHRRIFGCMQTLYEHGHAIDRVMVANELMKRGQLASIDGLAYLVSLDEGLPQVHNPQSYVSILKEKALLRRIIAISEDSIRACEAQRDPREILGVVQGAILEIGDTEIATRLQTPAEIMSAGDGLNAFLSGNRGDLIDTPWPELNETLGGGYCAGQLVLWAARPAVGKSAAAVNQAIHSARNNKRVAMYSLEMGANELVYRLLAGESGVSPASLRAGKISADGRGRVVRAAGTLADLEQWLLISDDASMTVPKIAADLHRARISQKPIEVLVIDYLGLMDTPMHYENRVQQMSAISRGLKLLAKEFRIPIIALSQLSRAGEKTGREPILSDLRDSGSLEQDADTVMFLHPKKGVITRDRHRDILWIVAKQRGGPVGRGTFTYDSALCKFSEIERYAQEPIAA